MNGYVVQDYEDKQIFKSANLYFFLKDGKVVSEGKGSVTELLHGTQDELPTVHERAARRDQAAAQAKSKASLGQGADREVAGTTEAVTPKKRTGKKKSRKTTS